MWKVEVTEIQDANDLDHSDIPPGAFLVTKERFAQTVENLDLPTLINVINRMQSSQGCGQERRHTGETAWRLPGRPSTLNFLETRRDKKRFR
ncbi:MAG TPA: hypothetical protein VIS99_11140 [Terrimicrobiaceae bacterium]